MSEALGESRPRWRAGPLAGGFRRETVHSMLRRCHNWNYCGTGTYLITLVLNDRSRPVLARMDSQKPRVELTELGRCVEDHFWRIAEFSPEIEVLGVQLMPDHLHGVLRVARRLLRPLGEHLRGFKIGATKIARELECPGIDAGKRGRGLFADGFVDTILFDERAVSQALAYIRDNPRRLWVKRANPELFRVSRDLCWRADAGGFEMHFSAIGNEALLASPTVLQVQCSRRDFVYAKNSRGDIDHSASPLAATAAFAEKAEHLLAAAAHGAVLVSPCISHGEKEIARRAFAGGYRVVTLSNKGFSPLYKPGGRLFDQCAAGNLLMLAPAGWPYLPGKKQITRMDACVLNRVAQLLAGSGAVRIDYHGVSLDGIEEAVLLATEARR